MLKPRCHLPALLVAVVVMLAGCETTPESPPPEPERLVDVECQDPRPEVCTFQYEPVCGLVDTGTRCVTAPCPASEWRTFSNGCNACSNAKVIGYREGACEDSSPE